MLIKLLITKLITLNTTTINSFRLFIIAISLLFFSQLGYGQTYSYSYTGSEQTVTLSPGVYKLETWGAQGGKGYINGYVGGGLGGNGRY